MWARLVTHLFLDNLQNITNITEVWLATTTNNLRLPSDGPHSYGVHSVRHWRIESSFIFLKYTIRVHFIFSPICHVGYAHMDAWSNNWDEISDPCVRTIIFFYQFLCDIVLSTWKKLGSYLNTRMIKWVSRLVYLGW